MSNQLPPVQSRGGGTDPNTTPYPGIQPTTPSGNAGNVNGGGTGNPGTGGGGAPATPAVTANGFDPQNLIFNAADGHYYAFRRSFNGQTYGYETVDVGDGSDWNAMAATLGVPYGALQAMTGQARTNAAQVQRGLYGKIRGVYPDGTVAYDDAAGKLQRGTSADAVAAGIPQTDIDKATAEMGQTQRTLTKMGQFTVRGMNPDGSLEVEDFNGNLSTVTAADAAGGRIAGVTYTDFQTAQNQYIQNTRTATQSQQWTAATANPDGSITVKDYFGNTETVKPDASGNLINAATGKPFTGISAGEVQYLVQQGTERNFAGQTVAQTFGYGGVPAVLPGAPAVTPAPPAATTTPPAPVDPRASGATPGVTPTPAPSPTPAYPTATGATPTPAPTATPPTQPAPTEAAPAPAPSYTAPTQQYPAAGSTNLAPGATPTGTSDASGGRMAGLNAQYQAAAATYNASGSGTTSGGQLGGSDAARTSTSPSPTPPTQPAPTGPTGTNALTTQQLALLNAARQNYYNLGRTAQSQQTAALAGQSRSGEGTGFGSIQQRQVMAGQQG